MRWKIRPTKGLGSTDADRSLSAGKKLSFQVVRMGNTIWCKEQKPGWFMANHPGLLCMRGRHGFSKHRLTNAVCLLPTQEVEFYFFDVCGIWKHAADAAKALAAMELCHQFY